MQFQEQLLLLVQQPQAHLMVSVTSVVEFPEAGMGRLVTINSELNGAI